MLLSSKKGGVGWRRESTISPLVGGGNPTWIVVDRRPALHDLDLALDGLASVGRTSTAPWTK